MSDPTEETRQKKRSGEYFSLADPETTVPLVELKEARYSLPVMLEELRLERRSSMFAMEILDQGEIDRIFTTSKSSHGTED